LRTSLALILVLLVPAPATRPAAQTPARSIPSIPEIKALLESTTPADQAWGAWWAAQAQARELAPLIERVASANATANHPGPAVTGVALDALVQLEVKVTPAFAMSFCCDRWKAVAMILLSRVPAADAEDALVKIAGEQRDLVWYTAADLLLQRKSARLAAILLRGLEIQASITVSKDGMTRAGSGPGIRGWASDGLRAPIRGFPPLAEYTLTRLATDAVLLADGPVPMYYQRAVLPADQTGPASDGGSDGPNLIQRFEFLKALHTQAGLTLSVFSSESTSVAWVSQAALDETITSHRADIVARYRGMLNALVGKGFMSDAESSELSSPRIILRIYDARDGVELPPTAPVSGRASVELTIPGSADFLAADGDDVWITNRGRMEKLARDKPAPVATVAMPRPCGVPVVAHDSIWVANCSDQSLYRIDRQTATVAATIPTGLADRSGELSVAAGAGAIWLLTDAAGILSRIDPRTNTVVAKIEVAPNSFAAAFDANSDSVWVTNTGARGATGPGSVQRIDPATNKVVATIPVGPRPRFLTAGEGAIWTLNQGHGTISRVDPKTNAVVATIDAGVPGGGGDINAGAGRVWVRATKTLLQSIDPRTNRIVEIFGPPAGSGAVCVAGDFVWVSAHDVGKVWVIPLR